MKPALINADKKSPYFYATFYVGGRKTRRSTHVPVKGGIVDGVRLTPSQARRHAQSVADKIAADAAVAHGEGDVTVRQLLDSRLEAAKRRRLAAPSLANLRTAFTCFLAFLGRKADAPASLVTRGMARRFAEWRRGERRHETVRKDLVALRAAFRAAVEAETLLRNPFDGIRVPSDAPSERIRREAFTLEEVRRLVQVLPPEWSRAVRMCLGTYGQRLGDVVMFKWSQFDVAAGVSRLTTGKTGMRLELPMTDEFRQYVAEERAKVAGEWCFPRLRLLSSPSSEFSALMMAHGIGDAGSRAGGARAWRSKTFHCLRSTAATMLHAAGVPETLAMRLVGHSSRAVHEVYVRPSAEQLAAEVEKLPSLARIEKSKLPE